MTIHIAELLATISRLPSPTHKGQTLEFAVLKETWASVPTFEETPAAAPIESLLVRAEAYGFGKSSWLEWELVRVNGLDA